MLKKTLEENGVLTKTLKRIECIDISIISGKFATGSLGVFTNGEKDSSWYRRFRIRREFRKNNDFAMMGESLKRRYNQTEWPLPDLIVVDGGKGQVYHAS